MKERPHQLCRLCSKSKLGLVGIYEVEGRTLQIESKIAKCLHIQVFLNDPLPLFVCHECCTLLNICNDFYEKANQSQRNLYHMLVSKDASQSGPMFEVQSTGDVVKEGMIEVEVDLVADEDKDDKECSECKTNITGEQKLIFHNEVKDSKKDGLSESERENGFLEQNKKKKVKRKISLNKADKDIKKTKYSTNSKAADGDSMCNREMGPGCDSSCRFKCQTKVTYEKRVQLFEEFWDIGDHSLQWCYIDKIVVCSKPQQRIAHQENLKDPRRKYSYQYFLNTGKKRQKVCQKMFLDTFGISNAWIRTITKKKINSPKEQFALSDMRGKHHNKPKRTPAEITDSVHEHIQSFSKIESHCCGSTTRREYLDETLSIKKMYKLYKKWMETAGRQKMASEYYYRYTFNNSYDLSFHKPKKDQCDFYIEHSFQTDEKKQNKETPDVEDSQNLMDQSLIPL